ncbi:pollen-specific protein C13-like [Musa acuminata AAA Group]|uniref:pollen-specific protein C13-like n=1 Tax=Musa acuminata AAA Group TaxID=214697 RepID=UPI0031D74C83
MAKLRLLPVVAALCLALAGVALAAPKFVIQGRVYCDTCRAGFETVVSQYIPGAKVKLQCRHYETDSIEHTAEGVTDGTGTYNIEVEDNHEEEICEVSLVQSPVPGCSEVSGTRNRARVLVTGRNGLASDVRYANSLGFLKDEPLKECGLLLQQYALGVDD